MSTPERQMPLFTDPPMARASDPDSSHRAADAQVRTGKAAAERLLLESALKRWPGQTSIALGERTGIERHEAARRLSDMRDTYLTATDVDPATGLGPQRTKENPGGYPGQIRWWLC